MYQPDEAQLSYNSKELRWRITAGWDKLNYNINLVERFIMMPGWWQLNCKIVVLGTAQVPEFGVKALTEILHLTQALRKLWWQWNWSRHRMSKKEGLEWSAQATSRRVWVIVGWRVVYWLARLLSYPAINAGVEVRVSVGVWILGL